jgi:AmmeMemoRadiSam system protein A
MAMSPDAPIPVAALMCHAPIVLPEVGGPRSAQCANTTAAMREAAQRLLAHEPDVIVVCSPHTPRPPRAFGLVDQRAIVGDLGRFGAPDVALELPVDAGALDDLERAAEEAGVATDRIRLDALDHGAMVPLSFVWEAGWRGRTLLFGFPMRTSHDDCVAMGESIRRAASARAERWALLASGDMSHRLIKGAPSGFHPDARAFDLGVCEAVRDNDLERAATFDEALRDLAAEDVVDSIDVARGALRAAGTNHDVLSYEGPFGVGYLVAMLHDPPAPASTRAPDGDESEDGALIDIAQKAVAAAVDGERYDPAEIDIPRPMGAFVTLHAPGHRLRGCVGRMQLDDDESFARQLAQIAVSAAMRDPRFAPVSSHELPFLSFEVSLLGSEEPCELEDLDPAHWGVSVSAGARRAVLLPAIEGIETPEEQLSAVLRKAGIAPSERFTLQRFPSRKIRVPSGG